MGKNRRKRSRSFCSSTAWKPVSVTLPGSEAATSNVTSKELDSENLTRNHYDDPKLSKQAEKDLPMNPGSDCAIFLGLEVLAASQYKVVGTGNSKRIVINERVGVDDASVEKNKKQQRGKINDDKDKEKPTIEPRKKRRKEKTKSKDKDYVHLDDPHPFNSTETNVGNILGDGTEAIDRIKKKRKNKAKESSPVKNKHEASSDNDERVPVSPDQLARIQSSWSEASGGAHIHSRLLESLHRLGFDNPTPIQAATLSASIMGRRNLVGAAPTGSGKTLAFLIPILNHILEQKSIGENDEGIDQDEVKNKDHHSNKMQALIMTPTRELATQIHAECDKLLPAQCVTLVGGIALVKQKRLLDTKKPSIVIATPGRLWAMLSSGEHEHLRDFSQIRFLVLDEADRMTQEHSFPQLISILDAVHSANPRNEDVDDGEDESLENDGGDRLLGLPGIRGEPQLTMLTDDIVERLEAQRGSLAPERREVPDDDFPEDSSDKEEEPDSVFDVSASGATAPEKVHRQTLIFSATLTLPFTSTKTNGTTKTGKRSRKLGLVGGIAEILEKTRAMGQTKVVDLSTPFQKSSSEKTCIPTLGVRLPPGLSLEQIKCTQKHKDSHLYAYLMTTAQGKSGPCLVFCNSVAAVRRVGATLQLLGFSVRILHAHMQQKARFKAVESLKVSKRRTVVVATDVAARGLDIPSVSTVVHYDVARAVDTFVHRAGRTARGIGAGAVGSSLSLIAPAEDKAHSKIVESLGVSFHKVLLDGRLLASSQERTNLASKIIQVDELKQKSSSHNRWFIDKAKEAELDLDDDLLENETNRSDHEKQQILEASKARVRLSQLLAEPMRKQKFGKFLSTNSEAINNGLILKSHV